MILPTKTELESLFGQRVYDFKARNIDVSFALNMEKFGYPFGGPGEEVTFNLDKDGRLFADSEVPGCETYCPDLIRNFEDLESAINDMGEWPGDTDEVWNNNEAWPNEKED